jgi:L-alanine-DL-glutamate epimerase-like enolase superfamily enzyme
VRITGVRTRIVSVPFRRADRWSSGTQRGVTTVLVLVDTDEGATGIGEANGDRSAAAVAAAVSAMGPLVVGHEPFDIEAITGAIFDAGKWRNVRPFANQAIAGIETALWDLVGKGCGQPVYNLMGGRVRDEVDFFYYLQHQERVLMVEEARLAVESGFSVIYLKVGVDDDADIATVAAIREAVGREVKIRVDANEAWTPGTAVSMIERLQPFELDFVEQPVASRDLDGLARVRSASRIPIAANQAAFTHFDVLEVIKRNAADVIVTGPHQAGGLLQFKKIAALVETAGLPINRHAVGELGVGAVAGLHVAVTLPNLTDGNQTHHQLLADDVLAEPLQLDQPRVTPPTRSGLGVDLDEDKVDHYEQIYLAEGQFYNVAPATSSCRL